ncbi:glycoside hydrolase family 3 protein [Paraurantiacibacter namhicola]|uniref:Periplasmic beta-glucosidase n=1 Tax=Paraurantiacibacter namhicola TaxID=645517 RepID=A0A1C7D7Q8_9SPHN|nr:glycoside hydrolase family 3 protein [Paraurantiacibacter namhicola]ANU07351.1 Periplasmic beta-glucosidase precursor [Paraurantiacibacter namhicola]
MKKLLLATACGIATMTTAACVQMDAAPGTTSAVMDEDAYIADIVSRMTTEQKVAQLIQPQINSFTPEDMARYRFGSYLNGGNGGPYGDEFAPGPEWLRYADEMYAASVQPLPDGQPVIPTMWGTDAVHGHTNVVGATIFPHNIGLGATRDAELVRRIGHATAIEIEVTGIDWNFSPTVAVAQDDRWGRTYESYSEDPQLVATMGAALVEGLQGKKGSEDFLGTGRVIATAKHFFGDGGTDNGVDQGEVTGDIGALKSIHAVPYPAAIDAGVESIMASFNSINGRKMHGNEELLTGVLRGEMGFDGLVVGDWNGHGQVQGCTVTDCPQSLLAGLDIYMVPDDWRGLMQTLVIQVENGTIPMARLDEAVTSVLRVKYRAGLLGPDVKRPSERGYGGRFEMLGSPEHRAIAREAVAKSQVILKNNGVLPLAKGANVLVAGSAADNVGISSGGWTLEWQGMAEADDALFPGTTSIWDGLRDAVTADGGKAVLSADGSFTTRPDVAVVVFGEKPYAEFAGDKPDLVFRDEEGLTLLRQFQAQGIPTVAVFLSGRPLWMNREMNASSAFVASWLPGSEGAGVADVLTGRRPATGRLSFSWPADCGGTPVNGPEGALFNFGYGRALTDTSATPQLSEECSALMMGPSSEWFGQGRLADGVTVSAGEQGLINFTGNTGGIRARGVDRNAQEDAREVTFSAGSMLRIEGEGEGNAYRITYAIDQRPSAAFTVTSGSSTLNIAQGLSIAEGKGYREMVLTKQCLADLGNMLEMKSAGPVTIRFATIERVELGEGTECSF